MKHAENAFWAVLHSAWARDDASDIENAKKCREIALLLSKELIKEGGNFTFEIIQLDLLRRTGHFEEVLESNLSFNDEDLMSICQFQKELAKIKMFVVIRQLGN